MATGIFTPPEQMQLAEQGVYSGLLGATSATPAKSATQLKQSRAGVTNGAYWYQFSDGQVRQMWTDFTTYAPYSFVMVTRIFSGSQNQYLVGEENVTDLAITPANSAPTRFSKLLDAHMYEIMKVNSIRWAIVGPGSTFYRLDLDPKFYSPHGQSASCSYNRGFYSGYSTPSSSPSWTALGSYQACGGGYDSGNNWLSLTGIHINDGQYFGGYSGSSGARAAPPSPYVVGGSDGSWSQNGYVLLQW